jgi:hemoglobin
MKDISTRQDIKELVDTFYGRVRKDELLGPVFNERIKDKWPEHLEKLYAFWQTVLFQEPAYQGSPFPPHAQLPVDRSHFQRWMELVTSTVDGLFQGQKATEAKERAGKMAEIFSSKIEYYKKEGRKPLL